MRNINLQVETDYARIKEESEHMAEGAVKEIVDEIMSIRELFD